VRKVSIKSALAEKEYRMNIFERIVTTLAGLFVEEKSTRQGRKLRNRERPYLLSMMKGRDVDAAAQAVNTLRRRKSEEMESLYSSKDFFFSVMGANVWTNFSEEDFTKANLQGVDLSGVDFVFRNANLSFANLQDANLEDTVLDESILIQADLRRARMKETNLVGANLQGANMQEADMYLVHMHGADLRNADLRKANLVDARMQEVNFENADLRQARLRYANFIGSNLKNALLDGAEWDKNTTLPDGSSYSSIGDLNRFTNPNHPKFWRPKNAVAWGGSDGISKRQDLSALDLGQNDSY